MPPKRAAATKATTTATSRAAAKRKADEDEDEAVKPTSRAASSRAKASSSPAASTVASTAAAVHVTKRSRKDPVVDAAEAAVDEPVTKATAAVKSAVKSAAAAAAPGPASASAASKKKGGASASTKAAAAPPAASTSDDDDHDDDTANGAITDLLAKTQWKVPFDPSNVRQPQLFHHEDSQSSIASAFVISAVRRKDLAALQTAIHAQRIKLLNEKAAAKLKQRKDAAAASSSSSTTTAPAAPAASLTKALSLSRALSKIPESLLHHQQQQPASGAAASTANDDNDDDDDAASFPTKQSSAFWTSLPRETFTNYSALAIALGTNATDIVQTLLSTAFPSAVEHTDITEALTIAARNGLVLDVENVKRVYAHSPNKIEHNIVVLATAAIRAGHIPLVLYTLELAFDMNAKRAALNAAPAHPHISQLHVLALTTATVQELVAKAAAARVPINEVTTNAVVFADVTPVHLACLNSLCPEILDHLLQNGGDPTIETAFGYNVVNLAAAVENPACTPSSNRVAEFYANGLSFDKNARSKAAAAAAAAVSMDVDKPAGKKRVPREVAALGPPPSLRSAKPAGRVTRLALPEEPSKVLPTVSLTLLYLIANQTEETTDYLTWPMRVIDRILDAGGLAANIDLIFNCVDAATAPGASARNTTWSESMIQSFFAKAISYGFPQVLRMLFERHGEVEEAFDFATVVKSHFFSDEQTALNLNGKRDFDKDYSAFINKKATELLSVVHPDFLSMFKYLVHDLGMLNYTNDVEKLNDKLLNASISHNVLPVFSFLLANRKVSLTAAQNLESDFVASTQGVTHLHSVVTLGCIQMFNALIDAGADMYARTDSDISVLLHAVQTGRLQFIHALHTRGVALDNSLPPAAKLAADPKSQEIAALIDPPFHDKVFVMTGFFSVSKTELEPMLEYFGGRIVQKVSSETTHCLLGRDGLTEWGQKSGRGSVKYKDAKKKKIPFLDEAYIRDAIAEYEKKTGTTSIYSSTFKRAAMSSGFSYSRFGGHTASVRTDIDASLSPFVHLLRAAPPNKLEVFRFLVERGLDVTSFHAKDKTTILHELAAFRGTFPEDMFTEIVSAAKQRIFRDPSSVVIHEPSIGADEGEDDEESGGDAADDDDDNNDDDEGQENDSSAMKIDPPAKKGAKGAKGAKDDQQPMVVAKPAPVSAQEVFAKFVNAPNSNGFSPIILAAQSGIWTAVESFVKIPEVDLNFRLAHKEDPKFLASYAAHIGWTVFYYAVASNPTVALALLNKRKEHPFEINNITTTPVGCACSSNETLLSRLLDEPDFDVNATDAEGYTLLHHLCSRNVSATFLDAVYQKRKDLNWKAKTNKGDTLLHLSSQFGDFAVFRFLLQLIDINEPNNDGFTPLVSAILSRSHNLAIYLIERKADINVRVDLAKLASANANNARGKQRNLWGGSSAFGMTSAATASTATESAAAASDEPFRESIFGVALQMQLDSVINELMDHPSLDKGDAFKMAIKYSRHDLATRLVAAAHAPNTTATGNKGASSAVSHSLLQSKDFYQVCLAIVGKDSGGAVEKTLGLLDLLIGPVPADNAPALSTLSNIISLEQQVQVLLATFAAADLVLLERLLRHMDVEKVLATPTDSKTGQLLLHHAVLSASTVAVQRVKLLLGAVPGLPASKFLSRLRACGLATVNVKDASGRTPLHYAVAANSLGCYPVFAAEFSAVLVEAGADPTVVDSQGESPSELAGMLPHAIASRLLEVFKSGVGKGKGVAAFAAAAVTSQFASGVSKRTQAEAKKAIERAKKIKERRVAFAELQKKLKAQRAEYTKLAAQLSQVRNNNIESLIVPVAEGVRNGQYYNVLIQDSDIYDTTLALTDIGASEKGANKYYIIQLLVHKEVDANKSAMDTSTATATKKIRTNMANYLVYTKWGRLGGGGFYKAGYGWIDLEGSKLASFDDFEDAKIEFCKKFKAKSGNDWEHRANFQKVKGYYGMIDKVYQDKNAVNYDDDDDDDASGSCTLNDKVQVLMKVISNVDAMKAELSNYQVDVSSLPLGRLSLTQIDAAFNVLGKLSAVHTRLGEINQLKGRRRVAAAYEQSSLHSSIVRLSDEFYTLVPHSFGMDLPPPLNSPGLVSHKMDMLNALMNVELAMTAIDQKRKIKQQKQAASSSSASASSSMDTSVGALPDVSSLDILYQQLGADIVAIDPQSQQYDLLLKYISKGGKGSFSKIHGIYKISRWEESERFLPHIDSREKAVDVQLERPNHMLLFHGSSVVNAMGILSQGLRIAPAEAASTGYMFGKGIYFADIFAKSANYAGDRGSQGYRSSRGVFNSGGNKAQTYLSDEEAQKAKAKADQKAFIASCRCMFMCEVALGESYQRRDAENLRNPPPGFESTMGVGRRVPDANGMFVLKNGVGVPLGELQDRKADEIGFSLNYNEFIVYDASRVKIKFMILFS